MQLHSFYSIHIQFFVDISAINFQKSNLMFHIVEFMISGKQFFFVIHQILQNGT